MNGKVEFGFRGSRLAFIRGVCIISLAIILLGGGCSKKVPVKEFSAKFERDINTALEYRGNAFRKYVEDSHGTVDVRYAYVSDLKVETKDGSDDAGTDGQNIRRIRMEITAIWDGVIHKGGSTVIGIVLENVNGKFEVREPKIIRTDALINLRDSEFWFDTGWLIGALIAIL